MTTTQEILRAAAAIVETSWSAEHDALDADGKYRFTLPGSAIPPARA